MRFLSFKTSAFSNFLVCTLESQTIVNDWAVVVFDEVSGFCNVNKVRGCAEHEGTDALIRLIPLQSSICQVIISLLSHCPEQIGHH
jgi:hypothetical protein